MSPQKLFYFFMKLFYLKNRKHANVLFLKIEMNVISCFQIDIERLIDFAFLRHNTYISTTNVWKTMPFTANMRTLLSPLSLRIVRSHEKVVVYQNLGLDYKRDASERISCKAQRRVAWFHRGLSLYFLRLSCLIRK